MLLCSLKNVARILRNKLSRFFVKLFQDLFFKINFSFCEIRISLPFVWIGYDVETSLVQREIWN